MNKQIFREYDIRGVFGKDFDEKDAELVGKAVAAYLKRSGGRRLVIGRDCRKSSPAIRDALIKGLTAAGMDATDVGMVSTPEHAFAIGLLDQDGGVMITASHNPPEYNGFKVYRGTQSIHGSEIQELLKIIQANAFPSGGGKKNTSSAEDAYAEYLVDNTKRGKPLKLVVDGGNGVAGNMGCRVLEELGHEVIPLYCEPDGSFPNHPADPSDPANLRDLIEKVKKTKADAGIAFDGDGDRIGSVNEKGGIVWGDRLLILYSRQILAQNPGIKVVFEVKCSQALADDVKAHGGKPLMWKTGHNLIESKMLEENALLAGEMSGHMYFRDRHEGFGDAIYAACRLAEILSLSDKSFSQLLADIPKYYSTQELRPQFPDEKKFEFITAFAAKMRKQGRKVIDLDGCRVEYEDGWGLVRASNTKPELSLRFEGKTLSALKRIYAGFSNELEKEGLELPSFEKLHVSQ
ncbi:phosphomannomutase/phosphoglucomutase [Candidatus Micrarchaeota archaeon]|nr:phosphomannomutase/phosphoglucomutase [Candidatus Micrarchaeota archaeon]